MQCLTLSLFDTWFWTNCLTTQGLKFLSVKWKEIPTELSSMGTTSEEMATVPEAQQRWIGDRWRDRWGHKFVIKLPLSFNIYCVKALKMSLSWGISNASTVKMLVAQLCLFVIPWTAARQAPLSMGFSRQEHWSELPYPPPGDLPDPGIEPRSPALQADSLPSEPPGKSPWECYNWFKLISPEPHLLNPKHIHPLEHECDTVFVVNLSVRMWAEKRRCNNYYQHWHSNDPCALRKLTFIFNMRGFFGLFLCVCVCVLICFFYLTGSFTSSPLSHEGKMLQLLLCYNWVLNRDLQTWSVIHAYMLFTASRE